MDKPHKFIHNWFKEHDFKEQVRLAQVRKLARVNIAPNLDVKVKATKVFIGPKVKANEVISNLEVKMVPAAPWQQPQAPWKKMMQDAFKIDAWDIFKPNVIELGDATVEGQSVFANGRAFAAGLEKKGFKVLGSGAYGSVLKHPKGDKVLKVLHRPARDGWPAYVKWASETGHAGTLAPLVYSYKYVKKGGFALASMEKLDQTAEEAGRKSDLHGKLSFLYTVTNQTENPYLQRLMDTVEPGMAKFCREFIAKFGRMNDLHEGNAMSRGEQLVITDPLSWYDGKQSDYDGRWKSTAKLAA